MRGQDGGPGAQPDASTTPRPALQNISIVNEAFLGTQPHDLSKLIDELRQVVAGALDRNEGALKDLITNFNTTMAAFASRVGEPAGDDPPAGADAAQRQPRARPRSTRRSRRRARSRGRSCRACARRRRRSTRRSRGSRRRASCSSQTELGGLVADLQPDDGDLASSPTRRCSCCRRPTCSTKCVTNVILPDRRHQDPGRPLTHRRRELQGVLVHDGRRSPARARTSTATACTCASRRAAATRRLDRQDRRRGGDALFGNAVAKPLGTRPKYPGKRPPYKPTCLRTQKIPTSTARRPAAPSRRCARQARATGLRDTAARRRAAVPGRRSPSIADELASRLNPFAGARARREDGDPQALRGLRGPHRAVRHRAGRRRLHPVQPALLPAEVGADRRAADFYTLKAEFSTAQAVTPGQGQTVDIAGVKVGEISQGRPRERARGRAR